ncbi:MAG TPA: sulfite exporter TauE/SafE family protein [Acidimicrobiales bacterium]|nr:sulfite exporter TauE/SafE family protein [Acidimicrobiales bacterium]
MGPLSALAIAGAGFVAGTVNVIVGSGTLVTFPALLALGYSPLVANVSNTVGLVPGSVSGVHAYRRELASREQLARTARLGIFSVMGSVVGSLLLFAFPGSAFRRVVPFLILLAVVLMALQPWISDRLRDRGPTSKGVPSEGPAGDRPGPVLTICVFLTGIYGGYFGAAQGVILISLLAIFVNDTLQRLNAVKNVLALLANFVASVIFAFSGKVSWAVAGVLALGAIVGGQVGGRLGRRLPQPALRAAVILVGTGVAIALLV